MKVLITGASGYVARVTLPFLFSDAGISEVVGLDVRDPGISDPKFSFVQCDVRDPEIGKHFAGVDVLVHMAFIVGEIKNKKEIYDINVNGTENVLAAAEAAGTKKIVVASSVCAYGNHPGRGVLTEDSELLGNKESYYSNTKRIMEKRLDEFEKMNPGVALTRLRPSILCGAGTDNFFLDMISTSVIFYPASNPDGLPIVYEKDVGRAFHLAVKSGETGAFNIHGGSLPYAVIGKVISRKMIAVPAFILNPLADAGYKLGLVPISSHWTVMSKHPYLFDCSKAERLLGWTPSMTPEESFREMVAEWKKR